MLLLCVRTNYTQSLGHVDQPVQEDSDVLFREQGGYRKNDEYKNSYDFLKLTVLLKPLFQQRCGFCL